MHIRPQDIIETFNDFSGSILHLEKATSSLDAIRASVLIPIICHEELTVLLTQRTSHLKSHAGQVSFPGGQWEESDKSPVDAALREAHEEIGLHPSMVNVISELGCWPTYSGYLITPVLGLLTPPIELTACEDEVAEIFEVPLSFLLSPNRFEQSTKAHNGQTHSFYHFDFEGRHVWGFTAGLLRFLVQSLTAVNI